MKSKIAEKILSKTSEEDKQRVREYANNLVKQSKMKHYYLINGKIMWSYEKMPEINEQLHTYNANLLKWSESLQPCEISESELEKVIEYLGWVHKTNPIEVTDIVEDKVTHQLLSMPPIDCYELFFKQPSDNNGVITFKNKLPKASERTEEIMYNIKQVEEIEAVEFAVWLLNYYNTSEEGMALCWINADTRIATKHTTKQLYEIFKNQK